MDTNSVSGFKAYVMRQVMGQHAAKRPVLMVYFERAAITRFVPSYNSEPLPDLSRYLHKDAAMHRSATVVVAKVPYKGQEVRRSCPSMTILYVSISASRVNTADIRIMAPRADVSTTFRPHKIHTL